MRGLFHDLPETGQVNRSNVGSDDLGNLAPNAWLSIEYSMNSLRIWYGKTSRRAARRLNLHDWRAKMELKLLICSFSLACLIILCTRHLAIVATGYGKKSGN